MPSKKVSLLSENNDSFLPEVRVIWSSGVSVLQKIWENGDEWLPHLDSIVPLFDFPRESTLVLYSCLPPKVSVDREKEAPLPTDCFSPSQNSQAACSKLSAESLLIICRLRQKLLPRSRSAPGEWCWKVPSALWRSLGLQGTVTWISGAHRLGRHRSSLPPAPHLPGPIILSPWDDPFYQMGIQITFLTEYWEDEKTVVTKCLAYLKVQSISSLPHD